MEKQVTEWFGWIGQGITIAGAFFSVLSVLIRQFGIPMLLRWLTEHYETRQESAAARIVTRDAMTNIEVKLKDAIKVHADNVDLKLDNITENLAILREGQKDVLVSLLNRGSK